MRLKRILFLALLLSCLSSQVRAGCNGGPNWLGNDAVGNDPDFSVRAHELGSLVTPSSDLAVPTKHNTTKPRLAPDERGPIMPQTSGPNMNMPDPSPKPLAKLEDNSNQTLNQTDNQSSGQIQTQPESEPMDVSGKWSIKFSDSPNRSLDLILLSTSSDRTMGSGTLSEDGTKIPLTASGSISGQELTLTAKTVVGDYVNKIDREYDLDLFMENKTLSGAYILKSAGKFLSKGNATAIMK